MKCYTGALEVLLTTTFINRKGFTMLHEFGIKPGMFRPCISHHKEPDVLLFVLRDEPYVAVSTRDPSVDLLIGADDRILGIKIRYISDVVRGILDEIKT